MERKEDTPRKQEAGCGPRTVGIGHQDFGQLIRSGCFYVDKSKCS